jgi:hypothetical protein
MKILILDDMKHRHDAFDERYSSDQIDHAYTYSDFLDLLINKSPYDIIMLDHDLDDLVKNYDYYYDGWGRKRPYNGQHAAIKVTELPEELLPQKVIIQSVNKQGAQAIFNIIQNRGLDVVLEPFDSNQ